MAPQKTPCCRTLVDYPPSGTQSWPRHHCWLMEQPDTGRFCHFHYKEYLHKTMLMFNKTNSFHCFIMNLFKQKLNLSLLPLSWLSVQVAVRHSAQTPLWLLYLWSANVNTGRLAASDKIWPFKRKIETLKTCIVNGSLPTLKDFSDDP